MPQHHSPIDPIQQPIERVASHLWFERLARFGYATKGLVYFVIGLLAIQAALGLGGRTTDSSGALETIVTQPFGQFLLFIVTIGIIGYVLWRFVQAILDPENADRKTDAKQVVQRIGYAISAIAYTGLAFTAIKLLTGSGGNNGNATQDWTARFMAQPFGRWLIGLTGILVISMGLYMVYKAIKAKFRGELQWQQMNFKERSWATLIGKFGIAARGLVFTVIGLFLTQAALKSDPSEAKGIGEALATLAQQPFGQWLLGFVALGLIAYSFYCLIEAKYRQIVRDNA
ncbi:MAG: DUF1206 domain-containing protein [Cyanobacteria bacterium CRU_2_1]|nr:DUF1206 domain-containing protein [Cyanobacteria bacterium CRU_2_1]